MSSSAEYAAGAPVPITSLQYRDISSRRAKAHPAQAEADQEPAEQTSTKDNDPGASETLLIARIEREKAEAVSATEQRLRQEYEQKLAAARAPISALIAGFEEQRYQYFANVEGEIVQLALSIAAKILHREAQVDPMLLAALVRLAVERMREGSNVTIRVGRGRGESWKRYFAAIPSTAHVEVAEDEQLNDQDCMLETELGSANFGLDSQLKEVEQGFFDLLALRPAK
jgi:flagellar assembly protein FliH